MIALILKSKKKKRERDSLDYWDNDESASDNDTSITPKAEYLVKRRFKNFSDKYDRGKLIGKGAFGQVYQCWLSGSHGKAEIHALKILKKNLLSQKEKVDDLLVNEFKILM